MTTIKALYLYSSYKDDATGYTGFFVRSKDEKVKGDIFCVGKIPNYSKNTELLLSGEMEEDKFKISSSALSSSFSFLLSVKGIGQEKIKKIKEAAGSESLFDFAHRGDVKEKLSFLSEKEAEKVIKKIKDTANMQEVFEYITSRGGSYKTTTQVQSVKKIKENPYMLLDFAEPFSLCEKIAEEEGIGLLDERRLTGLVKAVFQKADSQGHTYLDFRTFVKIVRVVEKDKKTEPFFLGSAILMNKDIKIEGTKIYLKKNWIKEENAAKNIKRLIREKKELPLNNVDVGDLEFDYDEEQKQAFELLRTTGVKILTGGPGTGKTTIMKGIVKAFEAMLPGAVVTLCAPTANAAKRLRESTGERALTIHKTLNIRPYGDGYEHVKSLPADLIIVDEASMLDLNMLDILCSAIKNGALLLLVGDEDQLPAVGCGNVFHDLLACHSIEKARLNTIHRQNGGSIVDNSRLIRTGQTNLICDSQTKIIYCLKEDIADKTTKIAEQYYDVNAPWKTKVYTPVKSEKYAWSTRMLNRRLHKIFNSDKEALIRGGKVFSKGDPVIMMRNNYETGYCNGDEGTVIAVLEKTLLIQIEERQIEIKGSDLDDVELAYALTAHKAQGAECETAIIVVPASPSCMLLRSIVYVAATRAKQKNIFIVEEGSLVRAIKNVKKIDRLTSLTEKVDGGEKFPADFSSI